MKKHLLLFAAIILSITSGFSQASFSTGAIEVVVNQYGRIRVYNSAGLQQMWRTSLLVGTSSTTVFDYENDAETLEPPLLVSSPASSDFEIYGAFDNTYSALPPDVIEKLYVYGWTNGNYIIAKYNVKNDEPAAINAIIGLDIIPYIDETDGHDTVTYNSTKNVIRIHRGAETNTGIKLLSAPLTSLYSFEWYDGYSVDADYWTWMTYNQLQPQYVSPTADGSVSITAQGAVALDPAASTDVYYAIALGANEQEMLDNIAAAEEKYQLLITSVPDPNLAGNGLILGKNYPNPFNESTFIKYQLPTSGMVSLKVYDVLGNEVMNLVDAKQTAGQHILNVDAKQLGSGAYYYTLRFNSQVKTNKMFIVK